jgi:transcriptional regulator with XRE-family HTH domain
MVSHYNTHVKRNFVKQKGETLGERIRRIRGETYQSEFGKRLGVSQGAVSAWERDDKERLPSADIYFRLATLAPLPEDQVFFLRKAGISREIIVSAANKLVKDRIVSPKEGDMVLIQPLREDIQENRQQIPALQLTASLAPHPVSTRHLTVNEDFAGAEVISCFAPELQGSLNRSSESGAPQMFPPLEMGDIILLDISMNDATDLLPFWGRLILVQTDTPPGPRYVIGQLGIMSHRGLVFTARLQLWCTNDWSENHLDIGLWRGNLPASAQGAASESEETDELYREAEAQARREIRLHAGYEIVGLVVGWLRPLSQQK